MEDQNSPWMFNEGAQEAMLADPAKQHEEKSDCTDIFPAFLASVTPGVCHLAMRNDSTCLILYEVWSSGQLVYGEPRKMSKIGAFGIAE